MTENQNMHHRLYKRLLNLYPKGFRERLGESMEQTFRDLCNEKRQTEKELFGFVLQTFLETSIGIFREYLALISPGVVMQTMLKTIRSPALASFLLMLPFMVMEVVNRREFREEFPFALFFVLWLNLFAVSLILFPIMRTGRLEKQHDLAHPVPTQRNTLLTNPNPAAIISLILFLSPGMLPLLDSVGWLSMDRLFNGPNPEVFYLPGQIINILLISFPIAAGVIAGVPVARTLRARGSLIAHPLNLLIVVVISFLFAAGVIGLIVDQWPCFMGVPNCD